jgi:hypothetical protein
MTTTFLNEATLMANEQRSKKEAKKPAAKTMKEKKADKNAKKAAAKNRRD